MKNGDDKSELEARKREREALLNDPIFAGEEFFFPPFEGSESDDCQDDFTEEGFKKVAKEILDGEPVLTSHNIGGAKQRVWRRKSC